MAKASRRTMGHYHELVTVDRAAGTLTWIAASDD